MKVEFFPTFVNIGRSKDILPSLDVPTYSPYIRTDEQRLMQVLLNLQSNALKFTRSGKVEVRLEIVEHDEEQYLQVKVIDTGVGIPYEQQDKLFKLFGFVKDTQALNTNGIGLGLCISE